MRILILVGGTNDPSNSDMLADAFADGLRQIPGTEVEKIRLKDLHIDHFTLAYYDLGTNQGEDFQRVERAVKKADGVLIATPIWNFGVPANVKNLIDRMGSFALDATHSLGTLGGKPFFLLYTGGTPTTAWPLQKRTTSHMPVSIRYFGGTVLGTYYEGRCTPGRGKFGLVVDKRPDSLQAARKRGQEFGSIVEYFVRTGRLPLKQRFYLWGFRTAQKIKKKLGI